MLDLKRFVNWWSRLTRDKGHLAQHDPTQGEIQVHLDIATDAMVQFDGDVTCMFHDCVWHVGEMDRLASEVLTADAEKYFGVDEDLERTKKTKNITKINI